MAKKLGSAYDPKGIDGRINRVGSLSGTVSAITSFQKQQVDISRPDQRIDVNGSTWNKLVALSGGGVAAPLPPPTNVGLVTLTIGIRWVQTPERKLDAGGQGFLEPNGSIVFAIRSASPDRFLIARAPEGTCA